VFITGDPNRSGDVADILLLGGGIVAVCGAFVAALFAVGIGGPPDDVILDSMGASWAAKRIGWSPDS
jgi:hypothetical protein